MATARWFRKSHTMAAALVMLVGTGQGILQNTRCSRCSAQESSPVEAAPQRLLFVESIEHPDLIGVNRLAVTDDNQFLYDASWRGDNLSIFSRSTNGKLQHVQSLKNPILKGAIKLQFNQDESRLAVICMRSSTILLFARNATSGLLQPDGFGKADMIWPTSVSFSPDDRFLYVGDAGGTSSSKAQSKIVIFRVSENGGLQHVGNVTHPEMIGMRNVFISPDGRHAYALCSSAQCIFAFNRDESDGHLTQFQHITDGAQDIALLQGVHSAWFSPDAQRMYTVAGRFEGTNGVTIFDRAPDGSLSPSYSWSADDRFGGGNDIQLTDDERTIIVSGTTGNSLAVLDNDPTARSIKLQRIIASDSEVLLVGPSGLSWDADKKFLHVAVENGAAITTFAISPQAAAAGE